MIGSWQYPKDERWVMYLLLWYVKVGESNPNEVHNICSPYLVMLSSKIISPSILNVSHNHLRRSRRKELHQVVPSYANNEVFHHFHQLAKQVNNDLMSSTRKNLQYWLLHLTTQLIFKKHTYVSGPFWCIFHKSFTYIHIRCNLRGWLFFPLGGFVIEVRMNLMGLRELVADGVVLEPMPRYL